MRKTDKKRNNRIIRDMKECFRSFHLPVNKKISIKGNPMDEIFTSQICNDHVCAPVAVTYDSQDGYVGIDTSFFSQKVPSEKMAEILILLNLMNEYSPLCGYSVCKCCNIISWRSLLYLSGEVLPKGKFRRLIKEMLENTYLYAPLIEEVTKSGKPEELYYRFLNDHKYVLKKENVISEAAETKILVDMESVITGLKISICKEDRLNNGFYFDRMLQGVDFPLRMGMKLENDNEMIALTIGASFTVPDEKIPVMTELINHFNRMYRPDHLFIHQQSKRVVLLKGVMIDNGVLDKGEFENSFRTLLGNGSVTFPVIKEQLLSNESPEVLMTKFDEYYKIVTKNQHN